MRYICSGQARGYPKGRTVYGGKESAKRSAAGLEALAEVARLEEMQQDFEVAIMGLSVQLQAAESAALDQQDEFIRVGRERDQRERDQGLLGEDEERYATIAKHLAKVLETYQLYDAAEGPLESSIDSISDFASNIRSFAGNTTGLRELNRGRLRQFEQSDHFRGMARFLRREVLSKLIANRDQLEPIAEALETYIACASTDRGDRTCD